MLGKIGGIAYGDISKTTSKMGSGKVIEFYHKIMSSPEYKDETEEIKAQSAAAADSLEGGRFGGRGEADLGNQQKATDNNLNTDNQNNITLSKENIANSDDMGYKRDEDSIVYRRVQGGVGTKSSRQRIIVNNDNSITIQDKTSNLNISIDNGEHSSYFRDNARKNNSNIIEFDVPKWFDDFLKEYTIPQKNYNINPLNQDRMAPKLVDPTKPGKAFELPAPWIEWLEEYAKNGRYKK